MRRAAALAMLALAACGSNGSVESGPAIDAFTAEPRSIAKGGSATLSWTVRNATQVSIDNGVGIVSGSRGVVQPLQTTTYTLTATGAGGTTSARATVTVTGAPAAPRIASFAAAPTTVARGAQATLSWSVEGAASISIAPGIGAVTGTSTPVTVLAATTYTLTATAPGGETATATASVAVREPVLHLDYAEPTGTAGAVRLVKNPSGSTDTRIQLDLVVGSQPISAFGVAMNLPFDVGRARLSATNPLVVGAIDAGASRPLAAAKVPAAGPLQNTLVLGVARKQRGVEVQLAPGTVLFSIAFDLVGGAPGGAVFDGTFPGLKFDAAVLRADGGRALDRDRFDIGQLFVAL